ncbi:MAG: GIY-YIG nuclease family protein [Clostridia bacterium]|nr:GIY-YIG nuclease family protein [Clostridia bacterium]
MAVRGKNISVYLMDGDATGRMKATIANWTGVAYRIPRTALDLCKDRDDLKQSGVYFLFGVDDQSGDNVVYIGQAGARKNGEGILNRLAEHKRNPDKDYWTEAVVFTTSNNSFGPTEISYLENRFCGMAQSAKRYTVKNGNDPTHGNITEEKESELEEFVDFARLIMGVLGHKVFEPLVKPVVVEEEPETVKQTPVLYFETKRVQATGCVVADGFVVIKGSRLDPTISKSCPSNVVEFRQKFSSRIIDDVLTEDVLLPSPSAAASFVSGSSRNGKITWKTAEGVAIGQLED